MKNSTALTLFSAITAGLFQAQTALATCDFADTTTLIAKVKDAIANARANCPKSGDSPKEFSYNNTYFGTGATTRTCTTTEEEKTFTYTNADGASASITTKVSFDITESGRAEVSLYGAKDAATGFYSVRFQVNAGDVTNPLFQCTGIIDGSETTTYTNSVVECSSRNGEVFVKHKNGRSCT